MSTSDPHRPGGATDRPDETPDRDGHDQPSRPRPSRRRHRPSTTPTPTRSRRPSRPSTRRPRASRRRRPSRGRAREGPWQPTARRAVRARRRHGRRRAARDRDRRERAAPCRRGAATAATRRSSTSEPAADTGRHAVVRPAPTPPDEPPTAAAAPVETPPDPVRSPTTPTHPSPPPSPSPRSRGRRSRRSRPPRRTEPTPPAAEDDDRLFPDPNAPRSTSVGSHILGVIVGLILGPDRRRGAAAGRVADPAGAGRRLGRVHRGARHRAGLARPADPRVRAAAGALDAGGPDHGRRGAHARAASSTCTLPSIAREQTLNILTSSGWRLTVTQVTVAGTSGMVLAVGFLLLLAGIVAGSARRRGARLGEFRERHRV